VTCTQSTKSLGESGITRTNVAGTLGQSDGAPEPYLEPGPAKRAPWQRGGAGGEAAGAGSRRGASDRPHVCGQKAAACGVCHHDLCGRESRAERWASSLGRRARAPARAPPRIVSIALVRYFNRDPAARGTIKTPGFISLLKISTGVFQFAAPERHHPTGTLETVQFGVSNVPGGLLGPEISQVGGWPSWPSGVPAEAASGRAAHRARTQQPHHACIGSSGYKTGP
jgi:hypothetical protein